MVTIDHFNSIEVAAAIIFKDEKVLIARRRSGSLAGFWEFPGGKIESNETVQACLVREIQEELSTLIVVDTFFGTSTYQTTDKCITLHAYLCRCINPDTITLSVHDAIEWVEINSLTEFKFAPADIVFVNKLQSENLYD